MTEDPGVEAPYPIVGIGASAGGVEALEGFFRGVPENPGLGFVVVTHLGRDRESLLHEIVARYTSLAVHIAADDIKVEIDSVYVLAVAAVLTIQNGHLKLGKPVAGRPERKPIDIFFSALALDQGERAAGVVLSGGDGDGTLGIKAIKEHGGLALAQIANGDGPAQPHMPNSAIATGFVDFAVPADKMGGHLVAFAQSLRRADGINGALDGPARHSGSAQAMAEIYAILRSQVGHDFSGYKTSTFGRRVQRRMQVTQSPAIESYVALLRRDTQEVRLLFRDLLINVTKFFRDPDAFAALAEHVIPKLFEGRGADDTVRIWVPGCSTGEEVFSLAILVREHMDRLDTRPRVQIFATDIDEHALSVARAARFPTALLDSVSPERQRRFFAGDGGAFVLVKEVRELCIFSPHSLLRDPPFSRIDLISCRNLLIYLGIEAQNQVLPTLHYALRPGGYLFLGLSENTSQFAELFTAIDKKHRIFRSRSEGIPAIRLPMLVGGPRAGSLQADGGPGASRNIAVALRQAVESQVLDQFSPPHVVINGDGDVVYYSARTGRYLEPAAGAPTRQLLVLVRRELRLDLRSLIQRAVETDRQATCDRLMVELDDGRTQAIALTVEPLRGRASGERLFLVLFREAGPPLSIEEALARSPAADETATAELERELRSMRERLQFTIEEYETALEELKVSNEELTSVNEEMQSTNEELEASKEELQSLNEELQTVNTELHTKVEALDKAHSDLQNLFESTDIATVFLDSRLLIRSFTPPVTRVFNILPSDHGRLITDLASRIPLPGFSADVATVLADGQVLERRIDLDDRAETYLVRLAPYRDLDRSIDGVVITFLNVTVLTRAELRQRVLIAELQHRTRNLLAVVQAIASQTLPKGASLDAYMDRLSALSRVQGLISNALEDEIDLADIVGLELAAQIDANSSRISIDGPRVPLSLERVQTFALALHELTTNAVKHGALKAPEGRLAITWHIEPESAGKPGGPRLVLDWRESGVAMPANGTERRGYGRVLIERALAFTLHAETRLVFGPDGVSCRIEMALNPGAAAQIQAA